jgi:hypothetical protein
VIATRAPQTHWLRGNKGERTPRRLIFLDTESEVIETEPREVQALRCWVARVVVRPDEKGEGASCEQYQGFQNCELAPLIDRVTKGRQSWRLFTHNLSYDLGLTRLPLALLADGWQIGKHNLASDQPWAYLKKGQRGLWLCDSWSWLPRRLEEIGELLGVPKPPLPGPDDSPERWLQRCDADVTITQTAITRLMDEWDRRKLGWWSITGPASGWNTLLHFPARSNKQEPQPLAHKSDNPHAGDNTGRVLIVPDPAARTFERTALYSGRRDVWKTGNLGPGPWAEIDLKTAHLTICANLALPYRRWAPFASLDLDDWRLGTPGAGLVAQVVVRTGSPRYPLRHAGVVLHPVGTFTATLAGPEILDAKQRGDLISIGAGYGYHLGHQMQGWATWALALLNSEPPDVEPMLQVAAKGWSRTVPGRWGMTHARPIKSGPSHVQDWLLEPITVGTPPRRGSIFHLAGTWTESINDQESEDSFPAVLAYIQSYTRLALNRMLDAMPEDSVVSCNTEGAWVADWGLERLAEEAAETEPETKAFLLARNAATHYLGNRTAPLTVQLKRTAERIVVRSPQHIRADGARLYSGVPRAALEVDQEKFSFQTWPKLRGQIERGDPRGYVREHRTVNLAGLPVSRWSFEDGSCEPVEVTWSAETGNVILPPSEELLARHGALKPIQHPAIRGALK